MDSPRAPTPPDPVATANAQTASNRDTALTQARLNNVNQVTPYGSLTYTASGGPQYDTAAYNQALDAYRSALGSPSSPSYGAGDTKGGLAGQGKVGAMPTLDQ